MLSYVTATLTTLFQHKISSVASYICIITIYKLEQNLWRCSRRRGLFDCTRATHWPSFHSTPLRSAGRKHRTVKSAVGSINVQ